MQLVSALPRPVNAPPLPAGDPGSTSAADEFLALLLSAGLDLPQTSPPESSVPLPVNTRADNHDDEPEKRKDEKQSPANDTPLVVIDPRVLTPQPFLLPLAVGLGQAIPASEANHAHRDGGAAPAGGDTLMKPQTTTPAVNSPPPAQRDEALAFSLKFSHSFGQPDAVVEACPGFTKQTQFAVPSSVAEPTNRRVVDLKAGDPLPAQPQTQPAAKTTPSDMVIPIRPGSEKRNEADYRDKQHDRLNPEGLGAPKEETTSNFTPQRLTSGPIVHTAEPEQLSQTENISAGARNAAPQLPADISKGAPLREITLKLAGSAEKPLDLHVVDEHGRLHVEVRTSDPQLASSLRDNVGDLIQKLDRSGFRSEPGPTHESAPISTAQAQGRDLGNQGGGKSGTGEQQTGGHGNSGQPGHQQQNGHGRGQRPRWLEEIVRNFQGINDEKQKEK